jgi:hypothetical protein
MGECGQHFHAASLGEDVVSQVNIYNGGAGLYCIGDGPSTGILQCCVTSSVWW